MVAPLEVGGRSSARSSADLACDPQADAIGIFAGIAHPDGTFLEPTALAQVGTLVLPASS